MSWFLGDGLRLVSLSPSPFYLGGVAAGAEGLSESGGGGGEGGAEQPLHEKESARAQEQKRTARSCPGGRLQKRWGGASWRLRRK